MKLLMVGSGGREHALIRKLKEDARITEILCAPGNGGIACDAQCFPVQATDIPGMLELAKEQAVDFVFVAPDDPLALGMVDAMQAEGFVTFGPRQNAAELESSKVFAKDFMRRYGIPTATYQTCGSKEEALHYLKAQKNFPVVIKADGLALGKGVVIAQNFQEAQDAVQSIMGEKIFGASGNRVVIEEFLQGPEVSVLAFCDGKTVVPMVSSMDHKRALDGNRGLNTGGMGTISPNPYYDAKTAALCMETIFKPTVAAMLAEGRPFEGCLYFGLILTENGPKVIEYNARFGDPEAQVVLPRLKTPLLDILLAIHKRELDTIEIVWKEEACACVIAASGGYPEAYEKGIEIFGLNEKGQIGDTVQVIHAGTKADSGRFLTNGGRVLGVTATGETLERALETAYQAIKHIHFTGMHYRRDIGKC